MLSNRIVRFALVAVAQVTAECRGEAVHNCFGVESDEPGKIPHLCCLDNEVTNYINFAVDESYSNDWKVVIHGAGNWVVTKVAKGTVLNAQVFSDALKTNAYADIRVDGDSQPFRFAFKWDGSHYDFDDIRYGWISLVRDANNRLKIIGAAMSTNVAELVVGDVEDWEETDPEEDDPDDPVEPVAEIDYWRVVDHGDWVSLAAQCITNKNVAGKVVVPDEVGGKPVLALDEDAFYDYRNIASLVLPSGLKSIGYKALSGCENLTRLDIPEGVTNVDYCGVAYLEQLGELTIPGSLVTLGNEVFCGNYNLSNVTIAAGCREIKEYAFANCDKLEEVRLPMSMETVEAGAFSGSGLKRLYASWATDIDASSSWPGATIIRYDFPELYPKGGGSDWYLDNEAKKRLLRSIGWQNLDGVTELCLTAGFEQLSEDRENVLLCASLGITPVRVRRDDSDSPSLNVEYELPTIRITKFDINTCELNGIVIPPEGSSIISKPRNYTIGMLAYAGDIHNDKAMYRDYVTVDTDDYLTSNGVVRITFDKVVFDYDYLYYAIIAGIKEQETTW